MMLTEFRKDGPALAALAAVGSASLLGITALASACITTPPPDLPTVPQPPPSILHASVVPPADEILTTWPAMFYVPVEVYDPSVPFSWEPFVDFDPTTGSGGSTIPHIVPAPVLVDAGVYVVSFGLDPPDAASCHTVELEVASGFDTEFGSASHTPNSLGGDSITWFYNPGGGPNGCPTYDAGDVQDGAFPGSSEGLGVTPAPGAEP